MFVSGFVSVHLQLQNIEFSDQLQIGGYKPVSQCWGSSGGGGGVAICEPKKQVCEAKLLLCCAHDRETVFSYC